MVNVDVDVEPTRQVNDNESNQLRRECVSLDSIEFWSRTTRNGNRCVNTHTNT